MLDLVHCIPGFHVLHKMQLDTEELTRGDPELKRLHQQLETLHRSLSEFKDIHYYNNPGWSALLLPPLHESGN